MNLVIGLVDTAADTFEIGAGIISNLFFGDDTAIDLILQWSQWLQLFKKRIQAVSNLFITLCPGVGSGSAGTCQRGCDFKQLGSRQITADLQGFQAEADILVIAEMDTSTFDQACKSVSSLLLGFFNCSQFCHGCQFLTDFLTRQRGCFIYQ